MSKTDYVSVKTTHLYVCVFMCYCDSGTLDLQGCSFKRSIIMLSCNSDRLIMNFSMLSPSIHLLCRCTTCKLNGVFDRREQNEAE